ncbi:ATP-binding protein (plasmid) [Mycoplasmatota bacterium]|nr:ATP-binding protein [Mycoplasmatota bacterium]
MKRKFAETHFMDLIVPSEIKFESNYFKIGSQYCAILGIFDYPEEVNFGWLSFLTKIPNVEVVYSVNKTQVHDLQTQIRNTLTNAKMLENETQSLYMKEIAKNRQEITKTLLNKIDKEQMKMIDLSIMIKVNAESYEKLQDSLKEIKGIIRGNSLNAKPIAFEQQEAFQYFLPTFNTWFDDMIARTLPLETFSASMPMTFDGLNDGTGLYFGKNTLGGTVILDIWKREGDRTNSNVLVLGTTGSGKSTTVKKMMIDEWRKDRKIYAFDPEREYIDLAKGLYGDIIDCSGKTGNIINPLEIKDMGEDLDEIEGMTKINGSLSLHVQFLETFFKLYIPEINNKQMSLLQDIIYFVYERKEITDETDVSKLSHKDYPIMQDVYETIDELIENFDNTSKYDIEDLKLLSVYLKPMVLGADRMLFNGYTSVEAESNLVVFDVNSLLEAGEKVQKAQFFNVLTFCWYMMTRDRTDKTILSIDEAYLFIDDNNPQMLTFIRNIAKRIRKYEGSLWVMTQNTTDFLGTPTIARYGEPIFTNPAYKVLMKLGEVDRKKISELMNLTEGEEQLIATSGRGQALVIAGNKKVYLNIDVREDELTLMGAGGGN